MIDMLYFQKSVGLPDVHSGYGFAIGEYLTTAGAVSMLKYIPVFYAVSSEKYKLRFGNCKVIYVDLVWIFWDWIFWIFCNNSVLWLFIEAFDKIIHALEFTLGNWFVPSCENSDFLSIKEMKT